jgi:hypothetical protein
MISQEASQFWQFPGSDLGLGLRRIADDKNCLYMLDYISKGAVAEIYVEVFRSDGAQQGRVQDGADQTIRDIEKVREFYSSPNRERDNRWRFYSPPSEDEEKEPNDEDYVEEEEGFSGDFFVLVQSWYLFMLVKLASRNMSYVSD